MEDSQPNQTTPHPAYVARQAIVNWVSERNPSWAWFATLTFRTPTRDSLTAASRLKSWLSGFTGRRSTRRDTSRHPVSSILWSAERHLSGSVHIHALLEGWGEQWLPHCKDCQGDPPHRIPWKGLNESWFHHHGIARFRAYDDSIGCGGIAYVVKYVVSDACVDWSWWEQGKDY
jgi:hypothetical protein